MPRPRTVAAAAAVGSTVTLSGLYGFLVGEALLARRAIGMTDARPPSPDGLYGADLPGSPIQVLVLGDSAAVGYGMERADATPSAMIGIGLAHVLDAQIDVRCRAVVGAKASDLNAQIDQVGDFRPDLAVIIIGTNDVTHQVSPRTSANHLGRAVGRLVDLGTEVVVGTCPDLGTVQPIMQPLRTVARSLSRTLARRQTVAVVEAGGRAVSLGGLLGVLFMAERDVMFGVDRFHPSETGYANMVSVLVPALAASWREHERTAAYAGPPRDVMSLDEAASEASQNAGTQVVQETGQGRSWATVLRRRR
ncbi:SGNH/GDSL hydrolase family protein [Aeromicrobium sp. CF3.5]|uniref:SGNH/GDSL hydrolase family protein n=1 Tax=Aeromicrobium sp. CF3.5 TaxID=3373078 RepID=UPI003EE6DECD